MWDNVGQWAAKRTLAAKNTDGSRRRQKPKSCTPKVSNLLLQQGLGSQAGLGVILISTRGGTWRIVKQMKTQLSKK